MTMKPIPEITSEAVPVVTYDGPDGRDRTVFVRFVPWSDITFDHSLITWLWDNDIVPTGESVPGVYQIKTEFVDDPEEWDLSGHFDVDPIELLAAHIPWHALGWSMSVTEADNGLFQTALAERNRQEEAAQEKARQEEAARQAAIEEAQRKEGEFIAHTESEGAKYRLKRQTFTLHIQYVSPILDGRQVTAEVEVNGYMVINKATKQATGLVIHHVISNIADEQKMWMVTHLDSSLAVSPTTSGFRTRKQAQMYAALLVEQADWRHTLNLTDELKENIGELNRNFQAHIL